MKQARNAVAIVVIALIIELFFFNFFYFHDLYFSEGLHNIRLQLEDFEPKNWLETEEGLVSEFDPMLMYNELNMHVDEIEIQMQADRIIPYAFFFYTDGLHPEFCENTMIEVAPVESDTFTIPVSMYIEDMRIDLGDEAGLKLNGLSITINPLKIDFSVARVIAMLVICFGFWGLNHLQRTPDYVVNEREKCCGGKDQENG